MLKDKAVVIFGDGPEAQVFTIEQLIDEIFCGDSYFTNGEELDYIKKQHEKNLENMGFFNLEKYKKMLESSDKESDVSKLYISNKTSSKEIYKEDDLDYIISSPEHYLILKSVNPEYVLVGDMLKRYNQNIKFIEEEKKKKEAANRKRRETLRKKKIEKAKRILEEENK